MKYANPIKVLFAFCCLSGLLSACTTASKDAWDYNGSKTVPLADTEIFLPVQERDETGLLLPYEAQPNPYTELSGRINKKSVTTYIDARRTYQSKKYDFADQLLTELIENEPKLSGPWVMRGDIAADQNNLPAAINHYAKAVEINSINFNAYLRLAKAQRQQGHFKHAQNTYAKALALWPDGPELHMNLGILYDIYLNNPQQAQAHMEAYQLLSKKSTQETQSWLAEVKTRTGLGMALKIKNAEGEFEIAQQPRTPEHVTSAENAEEAARSNSGKLASSKVQAD